MVNYKGYFLPLLMIFLLSLFMRLYRIDEAFFNFDQDRDAWEMKKMIVERKPTLIGPDIRRGRLKFFLGPYHYYFFLPSLVAAKLDPLGPIVFAALVGSLTTLLVFYLGKELFNSTVGLFASIIHAGSFFLSENDRLPWNPFHLSYLTVLLLYFLIKTMRGRSLFFPLAALVLGLLIQIHPTTIFLASLVILVGMYLIRKRYKYTKMSILLSLAAFFLVLSPLFFFEIRHHFLNSSLLWQSIQTRSMGEGGMDLLGGFWPVLSYIQQEIVNVFTQGRDYTSIIEGQWLVVIPVLFLLFRKWKMEERRDYHTILFLLTPWLIYLIGFSLFLGKVSAASQEGELQLYYFTPVAFGYIYIVSYCLFLLWQANFPKKFLVSLLSIFLLLSINWRVKFENGYSYGAKKKAVQFIAERANDKPFSLKVIDNHAFGYLDGFRYLFSLYGEGDYTNYSYPTFIISIPPKMSDTRFGNIGVTVP